MGGGNQLKHSNCYWHKCAFCYYLQKKTQTHTVVIVVCLNGWRTFIFQVSRIEFLNRSLEKLKRAICTHRMKIRVAVWLNMLTNKRWINGLTVLVFLTHGFWSTIRLLASSVSKAFSSQERVKIARALVLLLIVIMLGRESNVGTIETAIVNCGRH